MNTLRITSRIGAGLAKTLQNKRKPGFSLLNIPSKPENLTFVTIRRFSNNPAKENEFLLTAGKKQQEILRAKSLEDVSAKVNELIEIMVSHQSPRTTNQIEASIDSWLGARLQSLSVPPNTLIKLLEVDPVLFPTVLASALRQLPSLATLAEKVAIFPRNVYGPNMLLKLAEVESKINDAISKDLTTAFSSADPDYISPLEGVFNLLYSLNAWLANKQAAKIDLSKEELKEVEESVHVFETVFGARISDGLKQGSGPQETLKELKRRVVNEINHVAK